MSNIYLMIDRGATIYVEGAVYERVGASAVPPTHNTDVNDAYSLTGFTYNEQDASYPKLVYSAAEYAVASLVPGNQIDWDPVGMVLAERRDVYTVPNNGILRLWFEAPATYTLFINDVLVRSNMGALPFSPISEVDSYAIAVVKGDVIQLERRSDGASVRAWGNCLPHVYPPVVPPVVPVSSSSSSSSTSTSSSSSSSSVSFVVPDSYVQYDYFSGVGCDSGDFSAPGDVAATGDMVALDRFSIREYGLNSAAEVIRNTAGMFYVEAAGVGSSAKGLIPIEDYPTMYASFACNVAFNAEVGSELKIGAGIVVTIGGTEYYFNRRADGKVYLGTDLGATALYDGGISDWAAGFEVVYDGTNLSAFMNMEALTVIPTTGNVTNFGLMAHGDLNTCQISSDSLEISDNNVTGIIRCINRV